MNLKLPKIQDKKILKLRNKLLFSTLILNLISCLILSTYINTHIMTNYNIGITLFKLSIIYTLMIIITSYAFDKILKDIT